MYNNYNDDFHSCSFILFNLIIILYVLRDGLNSLRRKNHQDRRKQKEEAQKCVHTRTFTSFFASRLLCLTPKTTPKYLQIWQE